MNFVNVILINIQLKDIFLCNRLFWKEKRKRYLFIIFSCETQFKRKQIHSNPRSPAITRNGTQQQQINSAPSTLASRRPQK